MRLCRAVGSILLFVAACSGGSSGGSAPLPDGGASPSSDGGPGVVDESGEFGNGFLYGGIGNNGGTRVRVADDGSVYVAGGTGGDMGSGAGSVGGDSDAFVSRIRPNGKVAWTQILPTTYRDGATGLAVHPDGGVVVVSGTSGGSVTVGSVARLDREGRIMWNRSLAPMTPLAVTVTKEGRIFVSGQAYRQEVRNAGTDANPFGTPFTPVDNLGSTDGALLELGADGAAVRGKLFNWRLADQEAGGTYHAYDMIGLTLAPIPGTNTAYLVGVQQDTPQVPLLTGWLRMISLDTLETTWLRFMNTAALGEVTDDKYATTTKQSAGIDVCVDTKGNARTAWSQYNATETAAFTSTIDATGKELQRVRIPDEIAASGNNTWNVAVGIACHPERDEALFVAGRDGVIDLKVSHRGVLHRLDGAGKILGSHRPDVVPFDGLNSAGVKVMSAVYGARGIFFTGDAAGTFNGSTSPNELVLGNLLMDVVVGRVDATF